MSLTLHELQRRLTGFDIWFEVVEAVKDTQSDLIDYNQAQLYAGKRATGTDIRPEYAELTVAIKESLGQPYDRVTLKDTGDFYDSFFVDVNSMTFEIDATDWKTLGLMSKYGKTIFGLSKENRGPYIDYSLLPAIIRRIDQQLKLNIAT